VTAGATAAASIFERPARIRGPDDVVDVGMLLDDRIALVALDDLFHVGDVVAGDDRKPPRACAHGLVLGARELDEVVAADAAAFAQKRDPRRRDPRRERLR
jgi:hypothetical protein